MGLRNLALEELGVDFEIPLSEKHIGLVGINDTVYKCSDWRFSSKRNPHEFVVIRLND
jgi:hypothetical protein